MKKDLLELAYEVETSRVTRRLDVTLNGFISLKIFSNIKEDPDILIIKSAISCFMNSFTWKGTSRWGLYLRVDSFETSL